MIKKHTKLQLPLNYTKENFINSAEKVIVSKSKSQPVTFTLTIKDLELLEMQIDRAITLGKRSKNKSATIRMAIKALSESCDEDFLKLYKIF